MHKQIYALLTAILLLVAGTQRAEAQFNPTNPGDPPGGGSTGGGGGTTVTSYYFSVKANPAGACTNIYPASGNRTFGTQLNPYFSGVNQGYKFVNWTNSAGEVVSSIGDFYYYMPEHDETLTANFEYTYDPTNPGDPTGGTTGGGGGGTTQTSYYFSVKANPAGACTSIYPSSGNRTVGSQINPYFSGVNQGYKFVNWTNLAGEVVSSIGDFYYYMPSHDETLTANFDYTYNPTNPGDPTGGTTGGGGTGGGSTAAKYNLTVKTNPAGVCTNLYPASGSREEGSRVNPYYTGLNSNYRFVNWTNSAGEVISTVSDFYYYMPSHDETITANFEFYPVNPGDPAGGTVENPLGTDKVYGPRFSLDANNVVTIFCQTPAATIYYTTDGSEPTTASTLYTEPFAIESNTMVRAMATKEGMKASQITFYQIMPQRCEPPKIEFISGRRLKMSCPTPNAVIYYTTDLTTPDAAEGVGIKYDGTPLSFVDNRIIQAVAIAPNFGQSEILEYAFRPIEHLTAKPSINFDVAKSIVTISCDTPDATIYYTVDGSTPTTGSESSKGVVTFTITSNCTIKAMATSDDFFDSAVSEYIVEIGTTDTPVIEFAERKVAISSKSEGAKIYYTLDGSTPTREKGTLYSEAFLPSADCTVKAMAVAEGLHPSAVTSFVYRRVNHTVATPRFSRANDKLTLTCANAESQIYWIEGDKAPIGEDFKPTEGAKLYTEPISLSKNCVITARAMKENMLLSESVSFDVTGFVATQPVISFENRKVVISNGMTGHEGMIRYTIDGAVPSDSVGAVYSKPFLPTADCTVKAVFFTDNFNPSAVTEYVYRKAEHTVAKPQFSRKGNKIAITSETQGAQIFWGKGAEIAKAMPVVNEYETAVKTGADFDYEAAKATLATVAHVYTDSVDVVSNEKYAAIALAENMLIDYNTYEVSDMVAVKPVISFENRKVVISNGMTGHSGVIRYTIDGAVPTDSASVYSKPFLPTVDCTVKAVFFTDSFNPSAVTEYVYRKAEHTVAKPQFSRKGNKIAITSATQGAQIFWGKGAEIAKAMPIVTEYETAVKTGADFDYESAKATLAEVAHIYTDSVDVLSNEKYAAIALAENMLIDYATYEVSDMVALQPVISFENRKVVISNGMTGHEGVIRYTIDGTAPTDSVGAVYSKPFLPTADCTVKAVFFTDSFNPSAVTEYVYRKAEHTVAKPQFSRKGNKIAITSETQGAQIFWGKGAEIAKAMPVVNEYETAVKTGADFDYAGAIVRLDSVAHVYTDSIALVENSMFAAIALADNMLIDYATFEVTDFTCPGVEIGFARKAVWINPSRTEEGAKIMFKLYSATDSAQVIQAAREYTEPFLPATDCVVEAWMRKSNFNDSDSTRYAFVGAEHTLPVMSFTADFKAGTATLSVPEGETVGIGEAVSLKVNGIEVVSVTEGESVGQREVNLSRVLADQGRLAGSVEGTWTSIDRLENNPLLININKAKTPIVSHDGRMVSVESPQTTVIYSIAKDKGGADEGESSVEDSLTLPLADTGLMTCKAWNDSLLLSDEASIEIAAFHDGVHTATVRKAGALKDAFGWLQGETLSVEELTVTGPGRVEAINSDDLATLGGFTNLRRLNLENTAADESAGVFNAGGFAGLVEISLPKSGATAWNLTENTLLCAVHWNDSTKMSTGLANPNAVVFARESGLVAEGVNCVVGGASQRFTLTDGYPFYTPESFTAASASYVKRFSKTTTPGESRGWETVVLPFGVDKVTHLDKGREIAAFGDSDAAKKDLRRFWLAEAGNGGFKSASRIAANQPYLIAMPNSKEYLDDWNISGEIEFAATNATVSSELPARVAFGGDTREFTGTYFPLAASASRYALVAEADGDCFAAEKSAVKPMECYFEGQAGMMRIPIGSGESYLSPIATDDIEFRVFSEGGRVIVISPRDAQVGVYNIAGMLVKLLDITANEPATVDSLEHGIYIIANKKIIF